MKKSILLALILVFSIIGIIDASYLTIEHYANSIPPCGSGIFADCGLVLQSSYAELFGIPLAFFGVVHYVLVFIFVLWAKFSKSKYAGALLVAESVVGLLASLYFVYLMAVIIHGYCLYCLGSAFTSLLIFILAFFGLSSFRKTMIHVFGRLVYVYGIKRVLFLLDPEFVHVRMVLMGEFFGSISVIKALFRFLFVSGSSPLSTHVAGISFQSPIGLAAGFDYEARLTQILSSIGFGFQTVGTITNEPYEGNPRPMLGRLPKSKSLLVNKGYKNPGIQNIVSKLSRLHFSNPVGISIGKTNKREEMSLKTAIEDVVSAFLIAESGSLTHAYYELNISCPNLYGSLSFYPEKNLEALLHAVDKLKLNKPLFVKMPIEKTDVETIQMLKVIAKHSPIGVIIGNLQKDRTNKELVADEVATCGKGNFSGKPTYERSNQLIRLCYKNFQKRFVIIGCGGVFSPADAYEKITSGATLVQLITGMIFEGPQLISEINDTLPEFLRRDGFSTISQAIGSSNRTR